MIRGTINNLYFEAVNLSNLYIRRGGESNIHFSNEFVIGNLQLYEHSTYLFTDIFLMINDQ